MAQTKLIVIGGTGFIGHHLIIKAKELGWSITSLSTKEPITYRRVSNVNYIFKNLSEDNCLKEILSYQYDYIVNLSGYVNHLNYFGGGRKVIKQHFDVVRNIVDTSNLNSLKCFLNIGSSDEYGSNLSPQVENQREDPISPYSFGKTAATHFLEMMNKTEKFPSCTLRLFLVYGPGQNEERFLPQIIKGCLLNQSFKTSFGEQIRDFCYVEDVVEGILKTLQCPNVFGKTYNLASGKPIKVKSIIYKIKTIIEKGTPLFGKVPYRKGENMKLFADIKKIEKEINWSQKTSLDTGLKKTVEWYRNKWKNL